MEYLREIWFVIYAVIVIGVMVRIIMDNREPSKTMAWVLVLWFLPCWASSFTSSSDRTHARNDSSASDRSTN